MRLTLQCPHCKRNARVFHTTKTYHPAQEYLTGPRGSSKRLTDGINHNTFRPWTPLRPDLVPIEKRDKEQKVTKEKAYYKFTHVLECALGNKKDDCYVPWHMDYRHSIIEIIEEENYIEFDYKAVDASGHKAWDFQEEGIQFAARSGWRCLIADDMALGKTVQSALIIKNAKKFPVIVVVKQATLYNWIREIEKWFSDDPFNVTALTKSSQKILPGFDVYIVSMDLLGRKGNYEKFLALKPQMIIVDESHSMKDSGSNRCKALVRLCKEADIKHRIFLSGTPIKNRADEYFTILNLIDPINFPSEARFRMHWLDYEGKRIKSYMLDQFHNLISRYVIRRNKSVLKNMTDKVISPVFFEIDNEDVKNSYNRELDLMSNWIRDSANPYSKASSPNLLGWLAKIRALTGRAKVPKLMELVENFREEYPGRKLAIGIHHKDVRDSLYEVFKMKRVPVLKLSGEDSALEKDKTVRQFAEEGNDLLIINMISGGIGLNLQMCADTYLAERPWSYADEMQYIDRYHRPGQKNTVYADIIIAEGTIDEWFHELVEEKKQIFGATVDGAQMEFSEGDWRRLVEKTLENRL